MKTTPFTLIATALCAAPLAALAQGTYLAAPDGDPAKALFVEADGRVVAGDINLRSVLVGTHVGMAKGTHVRWPADTGYDWWVGGFTDHNLWQLTRRHAATGNWVNALTVDAKCNLGVGTTSPQSRLDVNGELRTKSLNLTTPNSEGGCYISSAGTMNIHPGDGGLHLCPGGGTAIFGALRPCTVQVNGPIKAQTLELLSDRDQKSGFAPVDHAGMLAKLVEVPITTWRYTNDTGVLHIGMMAQDFKDIFGFGAGDKTISVADGLGVAMAAIKGLNEKLETELRASKAENAALKQDLAAMRQDMLTRMSALEKLVAQTAFPADVHGASGAVTLAVAMNPADLR